jgi:Rrf2 family protein
VKFTRATRYALRALVFLASGDGRPVASHDIARAHGLPEKFLLKALKPLVSADILRSVKGPNGGYRLAKPTKDITLLEVVEASEAPIRGYATPADGEGVEGVNRRLQAACDNVAAVVRQNLEGVTVKDLAGGKKGR